MSHTTPLETFIISPPKARQGPQENARPVYLVLTQFSTVPKINFDLVVQGKSSKRIMVIRNPNDDICGVSLAKKPSDQFSFSHDLNQLVLQPASQIEIEITWSPKEVGSCFEAIPIKTSISGIRISFHLLGKCTAPSIKSSFKRNKPRPRDPTLKLNINTEEIVNKNVTVTRHATFTKKDGRENKEPSSAGDTLLTTILPSIPSTPKQESALNLLDALGVQCTPQKDQLPPPSPINIIPTSMRNGGGGDGTYKNSPVTPISRNSDVRRETYFISSPRKHGIPDNPKIPIIDEKKGNPSVSSKFAELNLKEVEVESNSSKISCLDETLIENPENQGKNSKTPDSVSVKDDLSCSDDIYDGCFKRLKEIFESESFILKRLCIRRAINDGNIKFHGNININTFAIKESLMTPLLTSYKYEWILSAVSATLNNSIPNDYNQLMNFVDKYIFWDTSLGEQYGYPSQEEIFFLTKMDKTFQMKLNAKFLEYYLVIVYLLAELNPSEVFFFRATTKSMLSHLEQYLTVPNIAQIIDKYT